LQSLVDLWAIERKPTAKTVQMATAIAAEMVKVVGHGNVDKLTRQDVIRFKDAMIAKHEKAPKTAWKKVTMLATVMKLAHENERIKANHFAGVKITVPTNAPKTRVGFSQADLKAIFGSPIYTKGERPVAGAGEAAYWLPLIAMYSGMRLEEIGQMLVSDVVEAFPGGFWYFDINNEAGKRVKNAGSVRQVPIHPKLTEYGFIDYVKKQPSKAAKLFPELKADRVGVTTGNFSKWFGRYLRTTIGITDTRKVFHSFRHGFKTACRDAQIPKEMHDALTGHREGDTSDNYGEVSLTAKYKAVQRVKFDGVSRSL
jgi:integrase